MAVSEEEMIRRVAAVSIELRVGGSRIFPSVRLAQSILETGGQAPPWNNVFGIKVGTGETTPYWNGEFVDRTTREVIDGRVIENMPAQWRAYDSIEDCVRDHELFLLKPRYAPVRLAANPQAQCAALYTTGYATDAPVEVDGDPSYGEKLWSIIGRRGLLKYDEEADRLRKELEERLKKLEDQAAAVAGRILELEERNGGAVPEWARDAMNRAVAEGLVDTPEGGSHDFYRILTVMGRAKVL